jgi:hypothetical protein
MTGARGGRGSRGGAAVGAGVGRARQSDGARAAVELGAVELARRCGGARGAVEQQRTEAEKKPHARLSPSSAPRSVAPS